MGQFSYSFAVSMMHSIWQSALLLGLFYAITATVRNAHPLFKRNLLFGVVAAQLLTTLATFIFYYYGSFDVIQNNLNKILPEIATRQWLQQYTPWFLYIYSVVVIMRFSFQLRNWLGFKKDYTASLMKPSADIKMFTTSKAHQFGITKKIAVWYSHTIYTPIVFGFFKPVILLPVALVNQLSISETEALIVHELTHIRYNDYLLNWMLLATETMYFFNPFIRIVAAKIKLEREKNCDMQVLQFNYCSIGYADALLKTARLRQHVHSFQLAAVRSQSQLLTRIRFFSSEKKMTMRNTNSLPFSLAGFLLLIGFTFSILSHPVKQLFINNNTLNELAINSETPALPASQPLVTTTSKPVAIEKVTVAAAQKNNSSVKIMAEKDEPSSTPVNHISTDEIREIKIVPVSFNVEPVTVNEGKDVIINEESSTGKMITRAFRVKLKDGVWVTEPLWVIAETKPRDSVRKTAADTVWKVKVVPVAQ